METERANIKRKGVSAEFLNISKNVVCVRSYASVDRLKKKKFYAILNHQRLHETIKWYVKEGGLGLHDSELK